MASLLKTSWCLRNLLKNINILIKINLQSNVHYVHYHNLKLIFFRYLMERKRMFNLLRLVILRILLELSESNFEKISAVFNNLIQNNPKILQSNEIVSQFVISRWRRPKLSFKNLLIKPLDCAS